MNDAKFFGYLLTILDPLRKEYDLQMMKKRLKYVNRYRERLMAKIKELEKVK